MKLVLKIALGVFIGMLAFNGPAVFEAIWGGITGWDAAAKENHRKQIELNEIYVRRAMQR